MTLSIKKALVTGASGFLGRALCGELSRQGVEVIAVVREGSRTGELEEMRGVRVLRCDMSAYRSLADYIGDRDVDTMYHLAWQGASGTDRADKDLQLRNVACSCDAATVSAVLGCSRFVFASSIMEIENERFMRGEGEPPKSSIYAAAKSAANYMARATAASVGVRYVRALISNIYGAGELSPRLINSSLRKIAGGERCSFSPGEQTYDFIYIDDASRAIAAIGANGTGGRTYYIGSAKPRPLKEFLTEMGEAVGRPDLIGLGDMPFSGMTIDWSDIDIDAVRRDTGVTNEVDFTSGIKKTYECLMEQVTCHSDPTRMR